MGFKILCYRHKFNIFALEFLYHKLVDNIGQMIKNTTAIGNNQIQTILWTSDEITHTL